MTLEIFLHADGDVAVFSTCLKLRSQKTSDFFIDHNKQRCHGDGAVYFMHSMTPRNDVVTK